MSSQKYLSASLFSGAGFGDMGFRAAGYQHLVMCEKESNRAKFTERNFPESKVLDLDVSENVSLICDEIRASLKKYNQSQLFLLYATPPCQGMSKNGIGTILKAMSDGKRDIVDSRNRLYLPALEVVSKIKPKWFFFENVCRLFKFKDVDVDGEVRTIPEIIERRLIELGYVGKIELVQMADYGLPQTRLRSVGIFRLREAFELPSSCSFMPKKTIQSSSEWVTLRDTIFEHETLDAAATGGKRSSKIDVLHTVPKWRPDLYFWMKNTPEGASAFDNSTCLDCGNINEKSSLYCEKCGEELAKPSIIRNGEKQLIKGFVSAYKRMFWDKPASTVTTRSAYACSDHKVHPSENRVLSLLEVAKVQGIDVDRVIWTNVDGKRYPDTLLRDLIGECVPPLFSQIVGEHLLAVEKSLYASTLQPDVIFDRTANAEQLSLAI